MLDTDVESLISILVKINNIFESENNNIVHINTLISDASELANKCLFGEDGYPNMQNINKVIVAGFDIGPHIMDLFGWVYGCISLPYCKIVF